jgi:hybrid cluster-associated redox disulfide protein
MAESKVTADMMIADLVENYPQAVDYLIVEYGFHCVSCFISSFETLEQGAKVHGIIDADFVEMLDNVNKLINGELNYGDF